MSNKSICVGLLAHVDAGKTTLSEAILYNTGEIRKLGRVDHGDSYLDTNSLERNRGITVFSKQASFNSGNTHVNILDTPGHVDFSAEMERVLSVIDYALLIISASEGIQSHTETLWRLLRDRSIPVIVFVNKMDLAVRDRAAIIGELEEAFGEGFVDFTLSGEAFEDAITLCESDLADKVLMGESLTDRDIAEAIKSRHVYPCLFGSALKLEGISELLECLDRYTAAPEFSSEFGARVFKITRDHNDERLTFMRLTGGSLRSRAILNDEKVNQIRVYSGMKFNTVEEAVAGDVVAVTGLTKTLPGEALGSAEASVAEELEPFVMHSVLEARDADGNKIDNTRLLQVFKQLGEEDPKLHVAWDGSAITVRLMGRMQLEILTQMMVERYGYSVQFGPARVIYAETISETVEGAGHFEPLRHYAEVHLILEPAERGSGITYDSIVPEDVLARNWQRLILTHLEEKEHIGVLIGAPITDMKITLAAGRAHDKHTNGGDFREATYRALRQGLMQARANNAAELLEPYTDFRIEVKSGQLGRIMTDIEQQGASIAGINQNGDDAILEGRAPSKIMMDYMSDFTALTGGQGRIVIKQGGYDFCANREDVIAEVGYEPERDVANTADSVFVSHSESDIVHWDEVMKRMHIQPVLTGRGIADTSREIANNARREAYRRTLATDAELQAIFERTFRSSDKTMRKSAEVRTFRKPKQDYISHKEISREPVVVIIDGYNLINADKELAELARIDVGAARDHLIDRLVNYQGFMNYEVLVVFDAYKVQGGYGSQEQHFGVRVIYTAQDEPADIRIGKMAAEYSRKRQIRIVSSDGLVQQNALVNNGLRVPTSEFIAELTDVENEIADLLDI